MIIDERAKITLLTAMECKWGEKSSDVRARSFSAISIRLKGDARITEAGKTEQLRSGDVFYIPEGAPYRLECGEENIIVVHFRVDGGFYRHMKVFHPESTSALRSTFYELYKVWSGKEHGYYLKALSLFYKILYEMERSDATLYDEKRERIKEAVAYLHSSYTDPELSVAKLCTRAYMSDTYFRRLFSEIYGSNPLVYLNDLRLSHAAVLLSETNSSIEEVARLSGFRDVKYFSTLFKKRNGLSPSRYKRRSGT